MKIFFVLVAACGALRAQITLERSDIGVVGASRTFNLDTTTAVLPPGPAGADRTWNFTLSDDGD
ncbi:MAG: hypothetical protein RMM53_05075, partial [Bacteroidia bacterium]|nr:hypothetical protein [Bacteroidia bacterium]MDW8333571.1 hypothetical protein [Bacteroidia bacterium]